jgi:hypothetical protein
VDEEGVVGRYSSISVDSSDLAHISYYDVTNGDLKYAEQYIDQPVANIKANGSNGPLFVTPGKNINITVSLDPGSMSDVSCDWWVAGLTTSGTYWLNPSLNWVKSDNPISALQAPLFDLSTTSLLNIPLPVGVYTFFFIIDNSPDGVFDITWGDWVNVFCRSASLQNDAVYDLDSIFQGAEVELFGK